MVKILANLITACLAFGVIWYVLYYWVFGPAIRHYRKMVIKRNQYEKEISEAVALDETQSTRDRDNS